VREPPEPGEAREQGIHGNQSTRGRAAPRSLREEVPSVRGDERR
jgi:hypothetical protein